MSEIILYKNNSDRKKLGKSLIQIVDITQTFRIKEPCNIIRPEIELSRQTVGKNYASVNYAYVPMWNRYYFVNAITAEHDSLLRLTMEVDPLMSYRAMLLNTSFEIARSESLNSKYYIDTEKALINRRVVSFLNIGVIPQSAGGKKYTLTVAGGA
jgi:hypothetical protein